MSSSKKETRHEDATCVNDSFGLLFLRVISLGVCPRFGAPCWCAVLLLK